MTAITTATSAPPTSTVSDNNRITMARMVTSGLPSSGEEAFAQTPLTPIGLELLWMQGISRRLE
jgi:hypothetical protein